MKHNYSLLLTLLSLTLAMPVWADTATRQPFWQQPNAATLPPSSKPAISVAHSEAIQIYTLPDGRYHAEVSYQDQQNNTRTFSFEGTPAQIREQVQKHPALSPERKKALEQALNLDPSRMLQEPMPEGNPFDQPFFKDNLMEDPFFKEGHVDMDHLKKLFEGLSTMSPSPEFKQFFQEPVTPSTTEPETDRYLPSAPKSSSEESSIVL